MNSSFLANAKSALLDSFPPISADFAGWEKQEWQQLQADPGVRVASEATHFGHWTSPIPAGFSYHSGPQSRLPVRIPWRAL